VDTVTRLLRDLITARLGVDVDDRSLETFMEKLSSLIVERGFSSALDYYYLLKYDADAEAEWLKLTDRISVRETFFWREFAQIRSLVEVILPKRFAERPAAPFRIWSAACASGEEPLTIAMAIDQAGFFYHPIEIEASDASEAALTSARAGLYRERSFRNIPSDIWERYFTREAGGAWRIDPRIHRRISWTRANLMQESEIVSLAASNVIFCRNVFIYFSESAIRSIVGAFARCILHPGYLCMGAPESLLKLTTDFELKEIDGAFFYVRLSKE
jgi:chemotaxis protein methyltransferase CheR